jgi:hypothetical protein
MPTLLKRNLHTCVICGNMPTKDVDDLDMNLNECVVCQKMTVFVKVGLIMKVNLY